MIGQTVGSLELGCVSRFPEETAVVYGEQRISYGQLHDRINRCAQALTKLSVKKGDRVCMYLPNCSEYVEVDFALAKIGAIKVPVTTRAHPNELNFIIND